MTCLRWDGTPAASRAGTSWMTHAKSCIAEAGILYFAKMQHTAWSSRAEQKASSLAMLAKAV
eukprot:6800414-Lingulodinium_polyedra.AAC.1